MRNNPMREDIVPFFAEIEKRLRTLEQRSIGSVYVTETIIARDPTTGVETYFGNLPGDGSEGSGSFGLQQWVNDTTPPPVPTAPMVSSGLGVYSIAWDGANANAETQAPDFSHLNVYGSNGTSSVKLGVVKTSAEVAIYADAEYGVPWVFWFTSVDQNGNESTKSVDSEPNTLIPLVDVPDLRTVLDDIDARYDGVITEAGLLDQRLAGAEIDLIAHDGTITNLRDVTLPAVDQRLADAELEITTTGTELSGRLDTAFGQLNTVDSRINTADQIIKTEAAQDAQTKADEALNLANIQIAQVIARGQSLIRNGDFEAGQDAWPVSPFASVETGTARSGTKAMRIGPNPGGSMWPVSEWVPSSSGRTFYFESWFKREGSENVPLGVGLVIQVKTAAGGTATGTIGRADSLTISDTTWTKVSSTFTPSTSDVTHVRFAPWVLAGNNVYRVDDVLAIDVTEAQAALVAAQAAQTKANDAHTLAGSATTLAGNALNAVSHLGKNLFSTNPPSGTAPFGTIWSQTDAQGKSLASWQQTGGSAPNADGTGGVDASTWIIRPIRSEMIDNLDVTKLSASTGVISEAVIEKLWADVIRARKITADQLLVGDGLNMVPWKLQGSGRGLDNVVQYGGGVAPQPTWGGTDAVTPGSGHLILNASWVAPGVDQYTWRIFKDPSKTPWATSGFPVEPGKEYSASIYYKSGGSYPDGTPDMRISIVWYSGDGSYVAGTMSAQVPLTWDWVQHSISGVAPATAAYAHIYVRQNRQGNVRVDRPVFKEKVDGSLIVTGSITGDHIEANSVAAEVGEFIELNVSQLTATTATMPEAVITKLWADVVHSQKITTDMLVVAGTNNVLVDTYFEDEAFKGFRSSKADIVNGAWGRNPTFNLNWFGATGQPTDRTKNFYFLASSGIADKLAFIPVEPGSKWRLKAKTNSAGAGARFTARYIKLDGSTGYVGISSFSGTGIIDHSEVWTIPADYAYVQLAIQFNTTATSSYVYGGASMVQMATGELVVDGAITAEKIFANSIEAGHIKSNAVTADKILAGSIEATHVKANAITTDKLLIGDGSNVFPDPTMKDITGWTVTSNINIYTGGYASSNRARITSAGSQIGNYYSLATGMEGRRSQLIPGRSYLVSVWIRPTVNISTSVISIYNRLYAATGSTTIYTSPSVVKNTLATTGVSTLPANVWTKMEGSITVPADSVYTFYVPGLYLESGFPSGSSCDFSNLTVTEMASGSLIVNGAIDGKTITGAIIKTSATANRGIEINGTGSNNFLRAFDTSGNKTLDINGNTGDVSLTGIVKTAISGARIELATMPPVDPTLGGAPSTISIVSEDVQGGSVAQITSSFFDFDHTTTLKNWSYSGRLGKTVDTGGLFFRSLNIPNNYSSAVASIGAYSDDGTGSSIQLNAFRDQASGATDHYTDIVTDRVITARLRLESTSDASESSTAHAFQIGASDSTNLRLDSNEILALSNGALGALYVIGASVTVEGKLSTASAWNSSLMGVGAGKIGIKVGSVAGTSYVNSETVYNLTTTGTANVYVDSSGWLRRSTSTVRNKVNLEPITDRDDQILSLEAKTWFDRVESEEYAQYFETLAAGGVPEELMNPGPLRRIPGMVAEEVEAAGLTEFVIYDENGVVQGLMYERLGVALIPVVARLRDRVDEQDTKIAEQDTKIANMESTIESLVARLEVLEAQAGPSA